MQDRSEPASPRRGRRGLWQYPSATMEPPGAPAGAPAQSSASAAPRAFAAAPARADRATPLVGALGWLSIGLGLAALLAPRAIARRAGLPVSATLLRAVGVRELVCGVGLLRQPAAPVWRWSRVAGDAMDLAMLGIAARRAGAGAWAGPGAGGGLGGARARVGAATMVVAGVTALDVLAGVRGAAAAGQARP